MNSQTGNRGVAPVVATVLLVAIVIVLATVVTAFVLDIGEDVEEDAPMISETSAEFTAGGDVDEQVVEIKHVAGENVDVTELEIVVDALDCWKTARLVDLPAGENANTLQSENVEGDEAIIDLGNGRAGSLIGTNDRTNTYMAGVSIEFRIPVSGCDFRDDGVEELRVQVVHTPTNAILIERILRADG